MAMFNYLHLLDISYLFVTTINLGENYRLFSSNFDSNISEIHTDKTNLCRSIIKYCLYLLS